MTVHGKAARVLLKAVGVRTKRDKKPKITIGQCFLKPYNRVFKRGKIKAGFN